MNSSLIFGIGNEQQLEQNTLISGCPRTIFHVGLLWVGHTWCRELQPTKETPIPWLPLLWLLM